MTVPGATEVYGTEPRLVGGRYQLGEVLGYGGMAEVHRGRDVRLGRDVAVKTLRADLARDPSFHARFRREAQSSAALNHPTIVSVYDTGEDEVNGMTIPYIVMEYVEGRTLRDVIHTEGPFTEQRALEIVGEVCAALDYSHRAGIIHRDIKPANVMLTNDGAVKVMDFGIARAITSASQTMTQTAAVIGTAQYLSPEQARGEPVDARSDLYSAGVLLYELLTGVPPFRGDSPVAVAYQHVREDPAPPSTHDPDISPAVDAIVLKAMAKNPANRYQSGNEMRDDLERAWQGRRVMATPVMRGEEEDRTVISGQGTRSTRLAGPTTGDVYGGEPPPPQRSNAWRYGLIAAAVVVVFVLAALIAKSVLGGSGGGGDKGTIPTGLKNAQVALAEQSLRSAGFTNIRRDAVASTLEMNIVVAVNPAEGSKADKKSLVVLQYSAGPTTTDLPDVRNQQVAAAKAQLEAAKFKVVVNESNAPSDKPAGTVVDQIPLPGKVAPGSTVTLSVLSVQTTVPNVVGMQLNAATTQLTQAGFTVATQYAQSTAPNNQVIDQFPRGTAQAKRGSKVTIKISQQQQQTQQPTQTTQPTQPQETTPPPQETTAPPQTTPPPETTPPPVSSTPTP